MLKRCQNPNNQAFPNYGGRGIKVYEGWNNRSKYPAFLAYMGCRPTVKHTLDRIDTNGDYEPGNVRWATRLEQNRHTRKSLFFVVDGQKKCLSQLTAEHGVNYYAAYKRLKNGVPIKTVLGINP